MFFEPLEDRRVLATIMVTSLTDGTLANLAGDGQISLREAIEAANTDTQVDGSTMGDGADTIIFDPALIAASAEIGLSVVGDRSVGPSGLLISSELSIVGDGITIKLDPSASEEMRLFNITAAGDLTIQQATISGGIAHGGDGGDGDQGGGGAAGLGGAIFNRGSLTIRHSTLSGNLA